MKFLSPSSARNIFSIITGAIFLCAPALYNYFPFIYADTGSYLVSGFEHQPSVIRAMTYGLFVRHICLMESLWLVILVQALFVSWMIHAFMRHFFEKYKPIYALAGIAFLSMTTSIGICTGMLMPDFLAPLMILSFIILVLSPKKDTFSFSVCYIFIWLSLACHHSHAYIFLIMLILLSAVVLLFRKSEFSILKKNDL